MTTMFPHDKIRARLIYARTAAREAAIADCLADALIDARRSGEATERVLEDRYGFTADELARHARAAKDAATVRWAENGIDPVCA